MSVFDDMGIYWAEIADQSSTQAQIQFIKNTLKVNGLVLDLACGTGRHSISLSKEGYDVVGLDVSLNLLKIAKNRWRSVQLIRGDMRFLPFKAGAFSASVSMDTSLGYLTSEQDDMQSLMELQEALSQGGDLIVDVFNRENLMLKYNANRRVEFKWVVLPILLKFNSRLARRVLFRFFKWREYPTFFLLQKRTVKASGDKLGDLWVVYDKAQGQIKVFRHTARLYELKHLQALLEKTGFMVRRVYGSYEGQSFSSNSRRLILVASKK
jgi:SAM-dependent methyltransferase